MSDEDRPTPGQEARERRRQQHRPPRRIAQPGSARKLVVPAIIMLAVVGIAAAMILYNPTDDCPGHWHSAYTVYVEGEPLPFSPQTSDWGQQSNPTARGSHIHGDDGVYHWHPQPSRCMSWREGLSHLDVDVNGDRLVLGEPHGQMAGTYEAQGDHQIRVFEQKWSQQNDTWREVQNPRSMLRDQPQNGDGLVIIYGAHTEEEIQQLLAQAHSIQDKPSYDPHARR